MKRIFKTHSWSVVFVFIFLAFALSAAAQKRSFTHLWEDTAINPHDFTNSFYADNGVNPKGILGRRTGSDSLSVFSNSSNPNHSSVRVLVTLPAYTQNGNPIFWYPLGEIRDDGFTDDKIGFMARETAKLFPIYVFPDPRIANFYSFTTARQAPLIDETMALWSPTDGNMANPLGIREIIVVNYTEKGLGKEGAEMREFFGKKNGWATDDTPIIKSMDDIHYLAKNEFVVLDSLSVHDDRMFRGQYAISPIISDPTKGAIATDAFIWMATKDGKPLVTEQIFVWQFGCLQKTGDYCK